jgi:hypothetical protein
LEKNVVNEIKLLKKYGGLQFEDSAADGLRTISNKNMSYVTKASCKGYKALAYLEGFNHDDPDEDYFENFIIDDDLMGLIYEHYELRLKGNHPGIKICYKKEHVHSRTKKWINWVPEEEKERRSPVKKPSKQRTTSAAQAPRGSVRGGVGNQHRASSAPAGQRKSTQSAGKSNLQKRKSRN